MVNYTHTSLGSAYIRKAVMMHSIDESHSSPGLGRCRDYLEEYIHLAFQKERAHDQNNPSQRAGPGRLLTECGHPAADHREARLSPQRSPGASGKPCYLPCSEERRAAPPLTGSRSLMWRSRPRRERGGRPEFVGTRIGGRFDCSGGRLAAPPLAGSRGLVVSNRQRQERGGRSKCGSARICGARPDCGSWGPDAVGGNWGPRRDPSPVCPTTEPTERA
ncbi:hypothetical protein NDU88_004135 [Pleurodeles waltl]|uniref:Uncharacterized protein n=1 Tax=Pleurodeles waltl TaxID=8319 RepID=A0AAV7V0C3_PLEWA|nr:hypothetical protein NDU88_004124 [Pleurodeles waltl]KAJ1194850.1 hypothetical protein NDU88_004135 [Pleurodeles waltl]